jgi:hypothetical protein
MMDDRDQPVDFSPLDPTRDEGRFDVIVRSVMGAAAAGLAERRSPPNVLIELGRWRRPFLAAAAVAALIAWGIWPRRSESPATTDVIATSIGMSTMMAQWIWEDDYPTAAQVFYTQEQSR